MGKPTYRAAVMLEGGKAWHNIGAAWLNKRGHINVKLNPLIDLSRMRPGDKLYLFPNDASPTLKDPGFDPEDPGFDAAPPDEPADPPYIPYPDDSDIPF